jgi:hypothetical protein
MIAVQEIRVEWTKASRGAPGAVQRNAVSLLAPLPPCPTPDAAYARLLVLHVEPEFRPRHHWITHDHTPHGDRHLLFDRPTGCQLREDAPEAAYPLRPTMDIDLPLNQWVQVRFNSRLSMRHHDEMSQWRWHRTVLNIGRYASWPDAEAFMGTPDRLIDLTVAHIPR